MAVKKAESQEVQNETISDVEQNQDTQNIEDQNNDSTKNKKKEQVAPTIMDENELIPVYNNTFGKLVYNSPRDNIVYIWHEYNEMEYLRLHELRLMKNNYPRYFKDGWVRVDHEGAIKHLRLNRSGLLKETMTPEDLEDLFDPDMHIDEFEDTIKRASNANKQLIAGMARGKNSNGEFDARRKIQVLEEILNIDLSDI